MKRLLATAAIVALASSAIADSGEAELQARLVGRIGDASQDRRVDEFDLKTPLGPGPKTGCHGDTVNASVTITAANVSVNGNVYTVAADYSGKYTRQGWVKPCIHSPGPAGHEDRNVSGVITFTVTQAFLKPPTFAIVGQSNVGEVPDPGHDSNAMAKIAAEAAIRSAF